MLFKIWKASNPGSQACPYGGAFRRTCDCCQRKYHGWYVTLNHHELIQFSMLVKRPIQIILPSTNIGMEELLSEENKRVDNVAIIIIMDR